MASFLTSLRDRAQAGLQRVVDNSLADNIEELRDENGNILSVGVNVDVKLDAKSTAIALAMVLAVAVAILLIKKGLKV